MITVEELDRAIAMGVAELSRENTRPVRCTVDRCRRLCDVAEARQVWIDGQKRGFVCTECQWTKARDRE